MNEHPCELMGELCCQKRQILEDAIEQGIISAHKMEQAIAFAEQAKTAAAKRLTQIEANLELTAHFLESVSTLSTNKEAPNCDLLTNSEMPA